MICPIIDQNGHWRNTKKYQKAKREKQKGKAKRGKKVKGDGSI